MLGTNKILQLRVSGRWFREEAQVAQSRSGYADLIVGMAQRVMMICISYNLTIMERSQQPAKSRRGLHL